MDAVYWIIIAALFAVAFIGLVYPIIPSAIFMAAGILVYGFFYDFSNFGFFFWLVQGFLFLLLLFADNLTNLYSVKKFGGTKAGMWGSTIGLLVGPFILPGFGILVGPFAGAVLAELLVHRKGIGEALKIGFGSLVGFLSSVVVKCLIQIAMIAYFLFEVL